MPIEQHPVTPPISEEITQALIPLQAESTVELAKDLEEELLLLLSMYGEGYVNQRAAEIAQEQNKYTNGPTYHADHYLKPAYREARRAIGRKFAEFAMNLLDLEVSDLMDENDINPDLLYEPEEFDATDPDDEVYRKAHQAHQIQKLENNEAKIFEAFCDQHGYFPFKILVELAAIASFKTQLQHA